MKLGFNQTLLCGCLITEIVERQSDQPLRFRTWCNIYCNGSGAILAVLELSWLGGAPPQWCGESGGGPTPEKKNQY